MGFFQRLLDGMLGENGPPPRAEHMGRNDRCWCCSGKKYKACHLNADRRHFAGRRKPPACNSYG